MIADCGLPGAENPEVAEYRVIHNVRSSPSGPLALRYGKAIWDVLQAAHRTPAALQPSTPSGHERRTTKCLSSSLALSLEKRNA